MIKLLLPITVLLTAAAATPVVPAPTATPNHLTADYVEVRTASVFAGACHFNGEVVTIGQDALLAFHITDGSWNNVPLKNLTVVASIHSADNLGNDLAPRSAELLLDTSTTSAQSAAISDMLRQKFHAQLGAITTIRTAPLSYSHDDAGAYHLAAGSIASLDVAPMPDGACCKQPNLVWYAPMLPLEGRKVGYTSEAFAAPARSDVWSREEENSAFYGTLTVNSPVLPALAAVTR